MAEETEKTGATGTDRSSGMVEPQVGEVTSVTRHSVCIAGEEINYTATAGTLLLKTDDEKPKASIFYVAYMRDGVEDVAHRPLTFAFNGGPGSSSVWLHLGLLGLCRHRFSW